MALLDLIIPPACAGCGRYGDPLCGTCRSAFRRAAAEGDRFLVPDPGVVVGDDLELALAAFAYDGTLRRALARLKYGGAARIARPLAEAAVPALRQLMLMLPGAVLVPVPVHAERLRQRGYNQAALLTAELGRLAGAPVQELLARRRPTTQQHRLNRRERLLNLSGAFVLAPDARPPPVVLLVDDILTTSATLEACAGLLRSAGGQRVGGFAIAREV